MGAGGSALHSHAVQGLKDNGCDLTEDASAEEIQAALAKLKEEDREKMCKSLAADVLTPEDTFAAVEALIAAENLEKSNELSILEKCLERGIQYADVNFPPTVGGLLSDKSDCGQLCLNPDALEVKYPKQWLGGDAVLFNDIKPSDVCQGKLGDCWLMGTMASIAEHPAHLKSIFGYKGDPTYGWSVGACVVNLYKHGVRTPFVIDASLLLENGKPVFTSNRRDSNELWMCMMEKAMAKLFTSYGFLNGSCWSKDAYFHLTGNPGLKFEAGHLTEEDDNLGHYVLGRANIYSNHGADTAVNISLEGLVNALMELDERGAHMTCFSRKFVELRDDCKEGLVPIPDMDGWNGVTCYKKHLFSILGVYKVKAGEEEHCLFKLRNPWGNEREWKGEWGDKDPKWDLVSEEVKEKLGYAKKGDGQFFMDAEDFAKYMGTGTICLYEKEVEWDEYTWTVEVKPGIEDKKVGWPFAIHVKADSEIPFTSTLNFTYHFPTNEKAGTNNACAEPYDILGLRWIAKDGDEFVQVEHDLKSMWFNYFVSAGPGMVPYWVTDETPKRKFEEFVVCPLAAGNPDKVGQLMTCSVRVPKGAGVTMTLIDNANQADGAKWSRVNESWLLGEKFQPDLSQVYSGPMRSYVNGELKTDTLEIKEVDRKPILVSRENETWENWVVETYYKMRMAKDDVMRPFPWKYWAYPHRNGGQGNEPKEDKKPIMICEKGRLQPAPEQPPLFKCPNGPHRRGVRCNECTNKIPFGMEPPSMPVDGLKKELERFEKWKKEREESLAELEKEDPKSEDYQQSYDRLIQQLDYYNTEIEGILEEMKTAPES